MDGWRKGRAEEHKEGEYKAMKTDTGIRREKWMNIVDMREDKG